MSFDMYLILHAVVLIFSVAFIRYKKNIQWSELGILIAIFYSFNAVYALNFLQQSLSNTIADLVFFILAGVFILFCALMAVLLVYGSVAKHGFIVLLSVLALTAWLGYFLNVQYEQETAQTKVLDVNPILEDDNTEVGAQNRALEQGIDYKK